MCDIPDVPNLAVDPNFYQDKQLNIFGLRFNLSNSGDVEELQKKFGIDASIESAEHGENIKNNPLFFYMFYNISKFNLDDHLKCVENRCYKFNKNKRSILDTTKEQLKKVKKALQQYLDSNNDIIKYHSNTITEHWRFTVFTYVQRLLYKVNAWINDKKISQTANIPSEGSTPTGQTLPPSLSLRLDRTKIYSFIKFIKQKHENNRNINISQGNINKLNKNIKLNESNNESSGKTIATENLRALNALNNEIQNSSKDFYIYVVDKILKDSMPILYAKTTEIITGGFKATNDFHKTIMQTHQCNKDNKNGIFNNNNREPFIKQLQTLIEITEKSLKEVDSTTPVVNCIVKIPTTCVPLLYNFIVNVPPTCSHNKSEADILNNMPDPTKPKDAEHKYINIYMKKDSILLIIKREFSNKLTVANTEAFEVNSDCNELKKIGYRDVNLDEYSLLHPSMEFILMLYVQLSKGIKSIFCETNPAELPNVSRIAPGTTPGTTPGFAGKSPAKPVGKSPEDPAVNLSGSVGISPAIAPVISPVISPALLGARGRGMPFGVHPTTR